MSFRRLAGTSAVAGPIVFTAAWLAAWPVQDEYKVHDLASLVIFVALIAAQLVLARAFRQDARWQDLRTYSMVSGGLSFALLVLYGSEAIGDSNGLVQRVFTAVPFVWVAVLGLRLRRLAVTDQRPGLTPERCA
jgi:hypothetical protein